MKKGDMVYIPVLKEGDYYIENGKYVLTKQFLLRRPCCHNGCRHCPYGDEMKCEPDPTEVAIDEFFKKTPCPECGFYSMKRAGNVRYTNPLSYGCKCEQCGVKNHVGHESWDDNGGPIVFH